jgi:hypothetical protein
MCCELEEELWVLPGLFSYTEAARKLYHRLIFKVFNTRILLQISLELRFYSERYMVPQLKVICLVLIFGIVFNPFSI